LPTAQSDRRAEPDGIGLVGGGDYSHSIMKTTLIRLSAVAFAAGALVFSACTKQDRSKVTGAASTAYEDTKAAMSRTWDKVRANTWDKRDEFTNEAKAVTSKMDEQIQKLQTEVTEANASASRKAAMAELKNSQADYRQKLDALGNATADTWESAKQNVILAWDKMQTAYYKARAD
jgi:hypothetical protein